MCGRYSLVPTPDFYDRFSVTNKLPSLASFKSAAPGEFLPIIYRQDSNIIDVMKWGLIPPWAKNLDFGSKLFNARSETILEKSSFRGQFNSCRCLVPASAFFEARLPFALKDTPVFSLAGLYSKWESPAGDYLPTFTIITTAANSLISPYHDRMPVILKRGDEETWLDPTSHSHELLPLFKPYESNSMVKL